MKYYDYYLVYSSTWKKDAEKKNNEHEHIKKDAQDCICERKIYHKVVHIKRSLTLYGIAYALLGEHFVKNIYRRYYSEKTSQRRAWEDEFSYYT